MRHYKEYRDNGCTRRVYYHRDGWLIQVWERDNCVTLDIAAPDNTLNNALLWAVGDLLATVLGDPTAVFYACDIAVGTKKQQK